MIGASPGALLLQETGGDAPGDGHAAGQVAEGRPSSHRVSICHCRGEGVGHTAPTPVGAAVVAAFSPGRDRGGPGPSPGRRRWSG